MDWQIVIAIVVVAAAAVYLLRRVWRAARSDCGCGGGCCPGPTQSGERLGVRRELVELRVGGRGEDDVSSRPD